MKPTLRPGLSGTFRYTVPPTRTVPHIYPDAPDFQLMPAVFATGYFVALVEWAAVELIKPHLDWPSEQSLGTRIDLTHTAATPPGLTVEIAVTLTGVEGRKLTFAAKAHDGLDPIGEGLHERFVIEASRFDAKLAGKIAQARGGA
jgi:fluoroacetyl-CoA thioesterase